MMLLVIPCPKGLSRWKGMETSFARNAVSFAVWSKSERTFPLEGNGNLQ